MRPWLPANGARSLAPVISAAREPAFLGRAALAWVLGGLERGVAALRPARRRRVRSLQRQHLRPRRCLHTIGGFGFLRVRGGDAGAGGARPAGPTSAARAVLSRPAALPLTHKHPTR